MRMRVEEAFGRWAGFVWRRGWAVILVMVALACGLGTRLPRLTIDTDVENYLRDDDPVKIAYDALREQFGRDRLIMLAIEPPEVFDLAFLRKLRALHRDLEAEVPHLEDVTSLVNVRSTYGKQDELVVEDLLEQMPESEAELAALRERVLATPSYLDRVISADGRITSVIIETDAYSSIGVVDEGFSGFDEPASSNGDRPFITGPENSAIVWAVRDVVARHAAPDFPVRMGGSVFVPHELQIAMKREMPVFFGASLVVCSAFLLLSFRRLRPVAMSLLVVVLAVVSTLGLAELTGFQLDLAAQVTPSFLLAVGVSYSVHLLTIFLQHLDRGEDRRAALEAALRHSGLPIVMTGVTTVVGLLAFLAAELAPINAFGVVSAMGVVMTLAYGLVLLPALIAVVPISARRSAGVGGGVAHRMMVACGRLAARYPWPVAAATLALGLASLVLATQVRYSSDPLAYLPEGHEYREATRYLDERFGGSFTLEVIVDAGRENGLHEPALLNRLDAMRVRVAELEAEGEKLRRTTSLLEVAKETHRALNENREEFYSVPQDRELVAQELLLFENSGSDDLERLVDPQFSVARFTVRTLWEDGFDKIALVERLDRELREIMGDAAQLTITGMSTLITRTVGATIESLARSYALALLFITPLMILLIGNLRAGLVSMVPNLVPIALTLGLMSILGITLDMFTLMIGCIAIGLAVDDSIHLIAGFRRYFAQTGDAAQAVDLALQSTGRAILFTSIVLTLGFGVFLFSSMNNLRAFGLLTGFAITAAFVLDVLATPALLVLLFRRHDAAPA